MIFDDIFWWFVDTFLMLFYCFSPLLPLFHHFLPLFHCFLSRFLTQSPQQDVSKVQGSPQGQEKTRPVATPNAPHRPFKALPFTWHDKRQNYDAHRLSNDVRNTLFFLKGKLNLKSGLELTKYIATPGSPVIYDLYAVSVRIWTLLCLADMVCE